MMLVTTSEVKEITGIKNELEDSEIESLISDAQASLEKHLYTKLSFTEKIDILEENQKTKIFTKKSPLLRVKDLRIGDTTISLSSIKFSRSGMIELYQDNSPEVAEFNDIVKVKYDYGRLNETETQTETTTDKEAGDNSLDVDDPSDFEKNDIIWIIGLDGNKEACKVTEVGSDYLKVDNTTLDHESGSQVTKLDVEDVIKRLIKIITGISISVRMVGQTYTFNTGYSLSDLSVQKGVPYTHWHQMANDFIKERDLLLKKIKPQYIIE
ncbi:MAG: hypothetical protein ACOC5T_04245 [Elusimicrobiota bacterium]